MVQERTISTEIDLKHQMPESDINKYITDINEQGIKIHPKIWQKDSNYLQLNGEGAYIKNSDNDLLAEFTANNMQIGQEKNGHSRIEITKDGLDVKIRREDSDIELAHMGPGKSARQDGSISNNVPYYSIGLRENSDNDYDPNSTYTKGETCIYNDEVYVCNTEISTPEAWNSNHWRFAIGGYSNAEGYRTIASGVYSHAEGTYTIALGSNSHAEGQGSKSLGDNSHAEGQSSKSFGVRSHAEGFQTYAIGYNSHAEGSNTYAEGEDAHAEGNKTIANGESSHAQNFYTIAGYDNQTVIGKYNDNQSNNAFEIGNGINKRSNAFTVDWDGNVKAQGWAGFVQMFAGATEPEGWKFCNGQTLPKSDYPELFAAIGTAYNDGTEASTDFRLPDLRGRTPIGVGQGAGLSNRTRGQKVGAETHKLEVTQIPSHSHTAHYYAANRGSGNTGTRLGPYGYTTYPDNHVQVGPTGGGQAHNNMQPSLGVNFIICTGKTS